MAYYEKKNIICELIFSTFILLSTIALITLIILIRVKRPKKYNDIIVNDVPISALESFDFIDDNTIPEYPHDNLGFTGKLFLNCSSGTCTKEIYHRKFVEECDSDDDCITVDKSWTEFKEIIEHNCSEQCYYNSKKDNCYCNEPYQVVGTCDRKYDDSYEDGKVCYSDNAIIFWKGKKIKNLKTSNFSYLEDVKLKDEECPKGRKFCGILDNDEKKLCIKEQEICPINYISENKLNNNYGSVNIGDKTFYYGNDDTTNRKIITGIMADTDLYSNKDNYEKEVIDNYTIKEFLEENKNLYKGIDLGYDPYTKDDIDSKGKSHLNIFYNNKNIDLFNLRQKKEQNTLNHVINSNYLNSIHYKTKVITILGLIALGILLLAFIIIIIFQFSYCRRGYGRGEKSAYAIPIVIFLILIITPLIFGCINIKKVKDVETKYSLANYSTFKNLNIAFIILGFILFALLIAYIVIVPIKFFKNEPEKHVKEKKNSEVNNTTNMGNYTNNISNLENQVNKASSFDVNNDK